LKVVNVPSKIYDDGRFVSFPLMPLDLARNLGLLTLIKAGFEVLRERLRPTKAQSSFESFAVSTYGKTIAERFLLNYSEKLWGESCDTLSPVIAGRRLRGLNLRSFIVDSMLPEKSTSRHLEGMFYYPKFGISAISKKLAEVCGQKNIQTNSKITGVAHNSRRIEAVEINGERWVDTDEVVSTLPLGSFLKAMKPAPPRDLLSLAQSLRYRSLILVSLFLDTSSVTRAATVYFPDRSFPFTRLYEPKNRCVHMSPQRQTSLVAEIPCQIGDELWKLGDDELVGMVRSRLVEIGLVREAEMIGTSVRRLRYAYPVLSLGAEDAVDEVRGYLESFTNLKSSGRNGRFVYSWIHDMMRFGREIVGQYTGSKRGDAPVADIRAVGPAKSGSEEHEYEQEVSL